MDGTTTKSGDECCCFGEGEIVPDQGFSSHEGDEEEVAPSPVDSYFDGHTGRKALGEYVDPLSTGRKEAAAKFPLKPGMTCEWAWQKNCGGGPEPITGCPGYAAQAIHHGPDKNTMKNVVGNVHRICHNCHNRWHGLNDPLYGARPTTAEGKVDASVPFLPPEGVQWSEHEPVPATDEEIFDEEKSRREYSRSKGNLD